METRLVNGVFKGGGAKGVAYAGALAALRDRNIWFSSVAGASAGAITASLVAAGLGPDEIEEAVPAALAAARSSIPLRLGKAAIGHASSVFESRNLQRWLDRTLAERIGKTNGEPVTFAELHAAFGIELYVVVMDLSNGLPVVFCRRTTPHVEVAGAVASSSAIPGAFPPGRGVFHTKPDGAVIHQFVDGGAWANYPSFVFQDRSFRTWLQGTAEAIGGWSAGEAKAWKDECDRPVVGLILGEPEPLEHRQPTGMIPLTGPGVNRRFDRGPTYTSPRPAPFILGSLLSSDWARLFIGLALAIWVTMSVVTLPIGMRRYSSWLDGWVPDPAYPAVLVRPVTILVLAAAVAIGLLVVLVLAGRLVADTLVPSLQALIGVPTEVPPWIGLGGDSVVLRVPHGDLTTTNFAVDAETAAAVLAHARTEVGKQLDSEVIAPRLDALFDGKLDSKGHFKAGKRTPVAPKVPDRVSLLGLGAAVVVALLVGMLGWWTANQTGRGGMGQIVILLVVGLASIGAGLVHLAWRTGLRAAGRAALGVTEETRTSLMPAIAAVVVGVAAVAGGLVLSAATMGDRSDTVRSGRVVAATAANGANTYTVRVGAEERAMISDRHLRLGERIYVRAEGDDTRLAGALEDGRFGVAVFLIVLGFGFITSGVKRARWVTRCRRLTALVRRWEAQPLGLGGRPGQG